MTTKRKATGDAAATTITITTSVTVRRMKKEEVEPAAKLCFDSFKAFNDSVGLPCEFDGVVPVALMAYNQAHPKMACFVAVMESTNELVGTNCVDLRDEVGVRELSHVLRHFPPIHLLIPSLAGHWTYCCGACLVGEKNRGGSDESVHPSGGGCWQEEYNAHAGR